MKRIASLAERVVVIGASGFGREVLDVLEAMIKDGKAIEILGVVDDSPSSTNLGRLAQRGIPYLGTVHDFTVNDFDSAKFVLGIGNPNIRQKISSALERAGFIPFNAIHPSVLVGSQFKCEPGVVICSGAIISTNVKFGRHVHINPNVTIGHDVEFSSFVSVNPAAVISGEVTVSECTLIGANSVILQNTRVGAHVTVGASAVVTKDVPSGVTVKGIPGRWET